MENAVYYVASPEACAAILWKSRDKAGTVSYVLIAARGLRICERSVSCKWSLRACGCIN